MALTELQAQDLARVSGARKWCACIIDADIYHVADEGERSIAHQRAGQQMRFAENLKAVADADHEAALGGKLRDALGGFARVRALTANVFHDEIAPGAQPQATVERDMVQLGGFCFYCTLTTVLAPILLWTLWKLP